RYTSGGVREPRCPTARPGHRCAPSLIWVRDTVVPNRRSSSPCEHQCRSQMLWALLSCVSCVDPGWAEYSWYVVERDWRFCDRLQRDRRAWDRCTGGPLCRSPVSTDRWVSLPSRCTRPFTDARRVPILRNAPDV